MKISQRRKFLKQSLVFSPLAILPHTVVSQIVKPEVQNPEGGNLKLSLNAYSFNGPLTNGKMDIMDMMKFCSDQKLPAIDITAYYFDGYPVVPPDEYLFEVKRKAFTLGLDISGTGVRNDFTHPEKSKREAEVTLVKNWIEAASKIGAPVIRIFAGTQNPEGYNWDEVAEWMIEDIKECVEFGKKNGVVVAIQNHNDFIKTGDQVIQVMESVDSDWFGLILDTGSYSQGDPYAEILKTIPYAVSWQIKELINMNGKEEPVDLKKLMALIKVSGYDGYLPIETLGPGDPKTKVSTFLAKVREALEEGA